MYNEIIKKAANPTLETVEEKVKIEEKVENNNMRTKDNVYLSTNNEKRVDYSIYTWYKGENENPYTSDTFHPLAAPFWEQERKFHLAYMKQFGTNKGAENAYEEWKEKFLNEELNNHSEMTQDPTGTNWVQAFETGKINLQV